MLHPGATYLEFQPSPELAPYIKCYALLEYNLPSSTILTDYFLPFGRPYLNINYRGQMWSDVSPFTRNNFSANHIAGQILEHFCHYHSGNSGMCGIFFHPSGFHRLFGLPMPELTHDSINVEDFFDNGKRLIKQIAESTSFRQKVNVLEIFFKNRLKHNPSAIDSTDWAIQMIQQNPQQSVDEVCKYFHVSSRSLRRRFKEKVGISPKYYLRICRFHKALQLSYEYPQIDFQDLSFHCGYYDLSHFSREFKQFSGKSPFQYFIKNQRKLEVGGVLQ